MTASSGAQAGGSTALRDSYIDLLSGALTFAMWDEPSVAVLRLPPEKRAKRAGLNLANSLLAPLGAEVARSRPATESQRREGKIWPSLAHTMIGQYRMQNVRDAVETVLREDIPGDMIETGVWRGGTCIFMRGILKAYGDTTRKVYVADSFAGLPPPDSGRYPVDAGDLHHTIAELAVSRREVEDNFRKFGLLDSQVVFVEGFFEHTLHTVAAEAFSVLRLDGDMYSSTIQALEALYPRLSPGGYCIIDDFGLKGCKQAVLDYRATNGITADMTQVDWTGVYWRKPR